MQFRSRPVRARGLKRFEGLLLVQISLVAPFTGAWIETMRLSAFARPGRVAPLRARGLKPMYLLRIKFHIGRALTGAWIETVWIAIDAGPAWHVAPLRARGLKH